MNDTSSAPESTQETFISHLVELRTRLLHAIIAVQTTLQPLIEMGIEPDYVTSLDYHEICARFFEKLPKTLTTPGKPPPKDNKPAGGGSDSETFK